MRWSGWVFAPALAVLSCKPVPAAEDASTHTLRDAGPHAPAANDSGTPSQSSPDAGVLDRRPDDAGRAPAIRMADAAVDAGAALYDRPIPQPPGTVPVFIAQGHVGRTVMSCDDGLSWVHDRSFDLEGDDYVCATVEPTRCWADGVACRFVRDGACMVSQAQCDCDHHPGAARGMAYGHGWFIGSWGWGARGAVRRSRDGVTWERVVDNEIFGGIAFGDGRFLVGARQPLVSDDDGASWKPGGAAALRSPSGNNIWNVRSLAFSAVAEGRFVITGEDGDNRDVLISADLGESFVRPSTLPAQCGAGVTGIAAGGGTIVIAHRNGDICYSRDGGDTFVPSRTDDSIDSAPLWTGDHFIAWRLGKAFTSRDGATWTSHPTDPPDVQVGVAGYNPLTGTFVAVRGGWQNWYEKQEFYRSADGVRWTKLPSQAATGGHPLKTIAFGYAVPSESCPP